MERLGGGAEGPGRDTVDFYASAFETSIFEALFTVTATTLYMENTLNIRRASINGNIPAYCNSTLDGHMRSTMADGSYSQFPTLVPSPALSYSVIAWIEDMLERDVNDNKKIGNYGAQHILSGVPRDSVTILTHCNTGSLATAGYGTALGKTGA